jgi:hypothetical protein
MIFNPVTINLTHLCNINCKHCNQVINRSQYKYLTIKQYHSIIQALRKINFNAIGLSGGEPLLHPDINWLILNIKKVFPEKDLLLVTNGLLMNRLGEKEMDCFSQISISWYKNINDDIINNYYNSKFPNIIISNGNNFYDPNLVKENGVYFAKMFYLMCPLKRLFLVGNNAYNCCLSNSIERVYNIKNLFVNIEDDNWIYKYKKLQTYKACIFCRFAELNKISPKKLISTLVQTAKLRLESNIFFRKLLLSGKIYKLRKFMIYKKSGFVVYPYHKPANYYK